MARTKKQTLVNAFERKRQIQEEIHRKTIAGKQKEKLLFSQTRENRFSVDSKLSKNGVAVKMDNNRDFTRNSAVGDCFPTSLKSQANMSSLTPSSSSNVSSLSEIGLPKAVICIPDICRSPTQSTTEESNIDSRRSNSRDLGRWGRTTSDGYRTKLQDDVLKKRGGNSKQSVKSSSSDDVVASLNSLKAASEKVREEKSKRFRHESYVTGSQIPSPERRSPRRHSPVSTDSYQTSHRKGQAESLSFSDEKPKINIFTDNLGLDLGKRIRSPRRLSEDMIPLPIFSARKWSNSPKENFNTSFSCSKAADEIPICDEMETLSLHGNLKSDPFKSPGVSPTVSKISNTNEFPRKTSVSPSRNESTYMSNKISESSISPHKKLSSKSNVNLSTVVGDSVDIVHELSELQQLEKTNQTASFKKKKEASKSNTNEDVEKMMSSICKELMSDGVLLKCENRFGNDMGDVIVNIKSETSADKDIQHTFNKENTKVIDSVNVNSLLKIDRDTEKETARNKALFVESTGRLDTAEEKPQSSLLCAMLVGGTEVAHSYSQERVRVKPQAIEIASSELDTLKSTTVTTAQSIFYPSVPSSDFQEKQNSFYKMVNTNSANVHVITDSNNLDDLTSCENKPKMPITLESHSTDSFVSVKNGKDVCENVTKKGPVTLVHQLKKLNESVLKLMEIDLEEEFLKDLEVDEQCAESLKDATLAYSEHQGTTLSSLITTLGSRLRDSNNQIPSSTPVDKGFVEKLIKSCTTRVPVIIPRLNTLTRMARIRTRMEEENLKMTYQNNVCEGKKMLPALTEEDNCHSGGENESDIVSRKFYLDSEPAHLLELNSDKTVLDKQNAKNKNVKQVDLNVSKTNISLSNLGSISISEMASSSLNDNLNSKDLHAELSAVTCALGSETPKEQQHLKEISDVLRTSTVDNTLLDDSDANKTLNMSASHSFKKSKTCDDVNDKQSLFLGRDARTLRRVNSSPQMNTKPSILPLSPSSPLVCLPKDNQTKSKLGSKIPVPGTSYVMKSKKSWRTPRTVVEPKPLSVLSELERKLSQHCDIFACPNLQNYLKVPSNRVIVKPEEREEMKILDAKALEEEEKKEKMVQIKEEQYKKIEEEFNVDYSKFEPDFDEVDGMLFMSFSSEVELRAHVIVEKALEWDKDDTMLRVSRAKAFEEAKALNEDMGHFKLKHLRGQHMRWKKYRRMYSNEVKALLETQNTRKSLEKMIPKKTSDISKIKGWKRKNVQMSGPTNNVNLNWPISQNSSLFESKEDVKPTCDQSVTDDDIYFMGEYMTADCDKLDVSPRSRGFSHQKAHRQLFRELNMDWEDRMIHRKLGGWSLKGNRPQAFSSAAKKRQEKKSKEADIMNNDVKDVSTEAISFEDTAAETAETKDLIESQRKKKIIKIVYPLLTERMAKNALKTLEIGDIHRGMRKKKRSRQTLGQLPALTPLDIKSESGVEISRTPPCETAILGLSPDTNLLHTLSGHRSCTSTQSPFAATSLEIDLQDEPVMEGVDVVDAENISSPSVTDTSSLKSCGKPGCRYGCICHLCSVSEISAPPPSPVAKQPAPVCDKEYCRLGCICDSIDPEKPISDKTHCRKPSCMLQCICSESGSFDGNEDIPYLPSMKRRPKPGERFSNLPQRERTHRSAKNLDAVTRKAMMLYETSEIYCERVERVRKKPESEASSGPAATSFDNASHISPVPCDQHMIATSSTTTFDPIIVSEPDEESSLQEEAGVIAEDSFISETTSPLSHPIYTCNAASQSQLPSKNGTLRISKPTFVLDDVRQTVPIIEPSTHKRKRKSHPLSDEIFVSSTCARTQPFKHFNTSKVTSLTDTNEDLGDVIEISPPSSTDSKSPTASLLSNTADLQLTDAESDVKQILPKIASVHTLASEQNTDIQNWENLDSEVPANHPALSQSDSVLHKHLPALQQTSQKSVNSGSLSGHLRQPYGWHKSMVCLKARAPPSSHDPEEEDIKEEDEVKLLEFAANCNWEGAKREILGKVAQCLTRGQYPQPRTMNVCEFVVEILPKAHQPSHIPPELRAKLPGQMYSIRVRITRRESVSSREDNCDVIDLSGSSPVKPRRVIDCGDSSVVSKLKEQVTASSDSFLSSSVGISGLSKLFITSPPVSGQHNHNSVSGNQNIYHAVTKAVSAPSSRRSSTDTSSLINFSDDHKQAKEHPTFPMQSSSEIHHKGSSFIRLGKEPSFKTTIGHTFNSESIKTVTNATLSPSLKLSGSTASKKLGTRSPNTPSTHPLVAKTPGVAPIFGPINPKDVKYMIPGKDGTMQLIEVGQTVDKSKKLIAVPITLSKAPVNLIGKQNTVVALPVSGMGQSRIVPVVSSQTVPNQLKTAPGQQIVLRLPASHHSPVVSGVRYPVVLQPLQSCNKGQPARFPVVPLQIGSCVAVSQSKRISPLAAQGSKPVSVAPKPLSNSDEMIMVFDAAHIKPPHQNTSSVLSQISNSSTEKAFSETLCPALPGDSTDDLSLTSEIIPTKLQTQVNGSINLTGEKMPTDCGQILCADIKKEMNGLNEYDKIDNATRDHLTNKVDLTEVGEKLASVSSWNGSIRLDISNTDFILRDIVASQNISSSNVILEQGNFFEANTACNNNHSFTHSEPTLKEGSLESAVGNKELFESVISNQTNSSSDFQNSSTKGRETLSKTVQEPVLISSKRDFSALSHLEEPSSPCTKKLCLAVDNPVILDEDSAASLNSMSGVQQASSSPLSNIDRPKSVMSGALSTGSSDDLLILLSSEEDVDVGEDDKPDNIITCRAMAERALVNDHGSMYTKKMLGSAEAGMQTYSSKREDRDGSKHVDRQKHVVRDLQKVRQHNQLERLRRSRMRVLFDELQQHVLKERGLSKDHVMSKVKVLVEAKKVVLHLSKSVQKGDELVKHYQREQKALLKELAQVKANIQQQDISTETISEVMKQDSEKCLLQSIGTQLLQPLQVVVRHPVPAEVDLDDSQEMINLVSPSTEEEKILDTPGVQTPVFEDIRDAEDLSP